MGQRRRGGRGGRSYLPSFSPRLPRPSAGRGPRHYPFAPSFRSFFFRKQSRATQFYLTSGAPAAALAGRTRPRRSRVLGPRAAPGTDARAPRRPGAGRALGQRGAQGSCPGTDSVRAEARGCPHPSGAACPARERRNVDVTRRQGVRTGAPRTQRLDLKNIRALVRASRHICLDVRNLGARRRGPGA